MPLSTEVDAHSNKAASKSSKDTPPRKPLTPYFRFMNERRPELHKIHPGKKTDEILRQVASIWNAMPEHQKKPYKERYEKEIAEYKKLEEKWWLTLTPSQKELFWDYKENIKMRTSLKRLKRKLKVLGRPKKPPVPHLLFIAAEQLRRKKEPRNKSFENALLTWKMLSEEEKKPFIELSQKNHGDYVTRILVWEFKMMKEGNGHLLQQVKQLQKKVKLSVI